MGLVPDLVFREIFNINMEQFEFKKIKSEETEQAIAIEQICFPPHEACSAKAMTERIVASPEFF